MRCSLITVARLTMLVWLLPARFPLSSQTTDWKTGIAKVTAKGKNPGAGFVVSIRSGRAYLVTSAHVVEGDPNPVVVFFADADKNLFQARVQDVEGGDPRGKALLVVDNPPAGLMAITPKPDGGLTAGTAVTVAGFPAAIGAFTVLPATVASVRGRDLYLTPETGEGFSGGPVLQNGSAVGLVYGREVGFGKAVHATEVKLYLDNLEGFDIKWGAQAAVPAPAVAQAKISVPLEQSPGTVNEIAAAFGLIDKASRAARSTNNRNFLIHTAIYARDPISGPEIQFLRNVAAAIPKCSLDVTAVGGPDSSIKPALQASGLTAYFQQDIRMFLEDRNIDSVLLLGFLGVAQDNFSRESVEVAVKMRQLPLSLAVVWMAQAAKDFYIFPGRRDWNPNQEPRVPGTDQPSSAKAKYNRISWVGDGSVGDLGLFCESVRARTVGPGVQQFLNLTTGR